MVLHPGHDELHGTTVIVTGASGRLYVGRWHEQQPRGVVMKDATIIEPASEEEHQVRLAKLAKFGIPPEHRVLVVPGEEFVGVRGFIAS